MLASGLSLVLVSLAFGILVLNVNNASVPEPRGIGFVPPVLPAPGRGFLVSEGLAATSCSNPVHVTLVVTGSAEYWIDHADALGRSAELRVAVPDVDIHNIQVGLGSDGKTAPVAPLSAQATPAPQIPA